MNILNDNGNYQSHLSDVVRQCNEYKSPSSIPPKLRTEYPNGLELPKNWKTLKELHDKVSVEYSKIKAEDNNKPIEYTPEEFQLHGLKEGNIELILPSEGATLVAWGKDQSHCVASYADRAARKELMILGVRVDDVHKYTLELRIHEKHIPRVKSEKVTTNAEDILELNVESDYQIERTVEIYQFRTQENCGKAY
jgi:PcfJ-like protein